MRRSEQSVDRFWNKVDKSSECWLWVGTIAPNGYAKFWADGTNHNAHRWIWEQEHGLILEGLQIDHTCHSESDCSGGVTCLHRCCVRLSHLELVSLHENVTRGGNTQKTRCPQGHSYDEENPYPCTGPHPYRQCRICKLEGQRQRRALA